MKQKPEAFIFDWDNTLSNTWDVTMEIVNHVLVAFNKEPWTLEEIKQKTHRSAKDFFPIIFGDDFEKAFICLKAYVKEKQEEHLAKLKEVKGAEKLLSFLNQNNIPCCILSNKQGERLRLEVDRMGWNDYFKGIYGSMDFLHDKPDPYPAIQIIEKHNFKNKNIWFVGDTEVDWECAKASGCIPVKIQNENLFNEDLSFKDCEHLYKYLTLIL